jgi:uroporphyrinogen-III synthase
LRERGIDAEALPLIEIAAVEDSSPLADAWQAIARQPSRRLRQRQCGRALLRRAGPTASPGPTTSPRAPPDRALRTRCCAQVARRRRSSARQVEAAQFDSEALWERLRGRDWRGARVLVVRGDGGRDWLADQLRDAGAAIETVGAYRRVAPKFAGAGRERLDALVAGDDVVWLFSSSEAIANLARAVPDARWQQARAVATHPRIAARARALGFGAVVECGATVDAVVACIQSIEP